MIIQYVIVGLVMISFLLTVLLSVLYTKYLLKKHKENTYEEYSGYVLYDVVKTNLGIGVITKFSITKDRLDQDYVGALIRYTLPYISYNFLPLNCITKV